MEDVTAVETSRSHSSAMIRIGETGDAFRVRLYFFTGEKCAEGTGAPEKTQHTFGARAARRERESDDRALA